MTQGKASVAVPQIEQAILLIRGRRVMLDADADEFANLTSQIAISSPERLHLQSCSSEQ